MPFAVMSGCILILMHMLPEGSEALEHTLYISHIRKFDEVPAATEDKQNSFPVTAFGPHLYSHFLPLLRIQ